LSSYSQDSIASAESTLKDKASKIVAVKVVDIFGNDTMSIVDVTVGKNGGRK